MNQIEIFNSPEFGSIRVIEENGKYLFCGADVAKSLGYKDTVNALKTHCREDGVAFYHLTDNLGRKQKAKFISEGNLYRLIVHSKLPSAERFEKWVFDEVLPTIRKHGSYLTKEKLWEINLIWKRLSSCLMKSKRALSTPTKPNLISAETRSQN